MARRETPLFLARASYRRRRLVDAAKLLPIFGALVFLAPLVWEHSGEGAGVTHLAARTAYLFGVWIGLVIVAAIIVRKVGPDDTDRAVDSAPPDTDQPADRP